MDTSLEDVKVAPEATEEAKEKFSDSIDFNRLFRVKGHKGLYYLISIPNKAGMCGFQEFLGEKRFTTHKRDAELLAAFTFKKGDGDNLTLGQVFDNLHEHPEDHLKSLTEEELMDIMVPGYDPETFKPYHAAKVIAWYSEVNAKVEALS